MTRLPASRPTLIVQLYVEVETLLSALEQARQLCTLTAALGPGTDCRVTPYWKMPSYYGLTLRLPVSDAATALVRAQELLAGAWAQMGDESTPSAVWDHRLHGTFALPLARWCELQVEPPAQPSLGRAYA